MLSTAERQRYARQISLPDIGEGGQERLKAARVLVVGAGGLGSPASMYLAAAGVGTIGLVDFDNVDISNLHRQLLHGTRDVGRPKVQSATERLHDVNPHVAVETYQESLTSANALSIVASYDLIIDACDNFPTRYLVNDAGVLAGVRVIYGSVERFEGQVSVFGGAGPCYRCLFRTPPPAELVPTCAEAGVFGVLPGLVGMIQATEAIKLLTRVGDSLAGKLLLIDAKRMRFRSIEVRRDPACPLCGTREQRGLIDYNAFCGIEPPASASDGDELEPRALAQLLAGSSPPALIDVREPWEYDIAHLAGAKLVPTSSFDVAAIPREAPVVLYCHSGMRSHHVMAALRNMGMTNVKHLRGGIDAWSREVDPSIRRY